MVSMAGLVAAEDKVPTPAWDSFAQYSVLGLAVLGFGFLLYRIFNQLWVRSGQELDREVARADRLEAENRAERIIIQEKAIPALMAASRALMECTEMIRELQRDRDYTRRLRTDRDGDPR